MVEVSIFSNQLLHFREVKYKENHSLERELELLTQGSWRSSRRAAKHRHISISRKRHWGTRISMVMPLPPANQASTS